MKKIMMLLLLGFTSLSFASADNVLFFQSSSDGVIAKSGKNTYSLTLKANSGYVSYFTDRPVRKAGTVSLQKFISMWNDKKIKPNFAESAPNVAINLVSQQGKNQNAVVEVSNPTYADNTVTYQLSMIDKKPLLEGNLKHVVLFFDDIHWNPGGF